MQESPGNRLGHLAANLLRIANFIEGGAADESKPIFRESKWFAEWMVPEADLRTQEKLVEVQLFLSCKEFDLLSWIDDRNRVKEATTAFRNWSNEFLKRGGFTT